MLQRIAQLLRFRVEDFGFCVAKEEALSALGPNALSLHSHRHFDKLRAMYTSMFWQLWSCSIIL